MLDYRNGRVAIISNYTKQHPVLKSEDKLRHGICLAENLFGAESFLIFKPGYKLQ